MTPKQSVGYATDNIKHFNTKKYDAQNVNFIIIIYIHTFNFNRRKYNTKIPL